MISIDVRTEDGKKRIYAVFEGDVRDRIVRYVPNTASEQELASFFLDVVKIEVGKPQFKNP